MDKTLLNLYAKRLAEENADDACAALKALEEVPRKEGESAMPDIGTILAAIETQRRMRVAKLNTQQEERLVRWRCPLCKATMCGFVKPDASLLRHCRGIPRKEHYAYGEVCGGTMDVVSNLAASVASGR